MASERVRRFGVAAALIAAPVAAYMVGTDASASPAPAVVVPITPCRLLDTRADNLVGLRSTPLGAGETVTFSVWGTNGNCTIPTSANGIVANVTIVNPTAPSFLTLYPGDASRPNASNLNWRAVDAPTPNLVSVALSATGTIKTFNLAGHVDVIIDITGYLLPTTSGAGGGRNRLTLDQIAQLRWDQDPGRRGTYEVGTHPWGAAFDGANIWVTNFSSNTVSKVNPTTGTRTDYPVGTGPEFVAYDGTHIWITNYTGSTISKIDPTSGTRVDYPTGDQPMGVAYDGTHIWIANNNSDTISKMNPVTGERVDYPVNNHPRAIAFVGTDIWIANDAATISKWDPFTGFRTDYPTGNGSLGILYDGTSLWVPNQISGTVSKVDPSTGDHIDYPAGSAPSGIAYDGSNIWITDAIGGTVAKMDPVLGTRVDYPTGWLPIGIVYDGTNIWVVNAGDNSVSKILP